ncbi:MAG: IS21 family transposase, partial [Clostridia bacterium]|nr:IS21 family transposase [Clostridia bacterium]
MNKVAFQKLEELNERPFKQRVGNRKSAYLNEEKAYMLPLPASSYEPAVWSVAKVGTDYLISDGRCKYS